MQAIILAAGMGKRLKELTSNATKCMVEVNGEMMIHKTLMHLEKLNLNKIVLVVGYEGQQLMDYVNSLGLKTPVEYVVNDVYDKTNNIYSLYLAKEYLLQDDTLLLESDLVYEEAVIRKLVDTPYPSLVLVDKFESWMDGTCITVDEDDNITSFVSKREFDFTKTDEYYKTVNLYKFSKNFSEKYYVPFLEAYCNAMGLNEYYEQVLKVITFLGDLEIKAVKLNGEKWYEIDDVQDLDIAESMLAGKEEKLEKMQKRFGGYWRYPKLIDFCYLVNPYFPNKKLVSEMQTNFQRLLGEYPSGMGVNSLIAAKIFGLHASQVIVGNGAAELIKSLMERFTGRLGMAFPTFQEYPNRKAEKDVVPYFVTNDEFRYTAKNLMDFCMNHQLSMTNLLLLGIRTYLSKVNNGQEDITIQNFISRRSTHDEWTSGGSRTIMFPCRTVISPETDFLSAAYEIQNMQNRIYMHSNYDPAFIVDEMRKRYHTPEHTSYESCYLTYQPMPVKVENEMLGTVRQHAKWFANGAATKKMYLTVSHTEDGGMNFSYHYQTAHLEEHDMELLYYYMMRILFKGIAEPDMSIGEIMELV